MRCHKRRSLTINTRAIPSTPQAIKSNQPNQDIRPKPTISFCRYQPPSYEGKLVLWGQYRTIFCDLALAEINCEEVGFLPSRATAPTYRGSVPPLRIRGNPIATARQAGMRHSSNIDTEHPYCHVSDDQ